MKKNVGPNKIEFYLDPSTYHEELYLNNFFKNEEDYYINLLSSYNDPIVFDVGSNIGYFTCLFKSSGSKEVHSFEPVLYPYQISKERLNGIDGLYFNNFALHDKIGSGEMYISKKHNQGSTFSKKIVGKFKKVFAIDDEPLSTVIVNTSTLDKYCVLNNIQSIDLLKLDTEGTEYNILKGSMQMITRNRIKNIIYESYDQIIQIEKMLTSFGYEIHKIENLTTPMFHAKLKS